MSEPLHPLYKRWLSECFDSVIDLDDHEEEIFEAIAQQVKTQRAVGAMLDGSLSLKDMLETIEDCVPNMDHYMDGVTENLIDFNVKIYHASRSI
jgi:hypothetical protein